MYLNRINCSQDVVLYYRATYLRRCLIEIRATSHMRLRCLPHEGHRQAPGRLGLAVGSQRHLTAGWATVPHKGLPVTGSRSFRPPSTHSAAQQQRPGDYSAAAEARALFRQQQGLGSILGSLWRRVGRVRVEEGGPRAGWPRIVGNPGTTPWKSWLPPTPATVVPATPHYRPWGSTSAAPAN